MQSDKPLVLSDGDVLSGLYQGSVIADSGAVEIAGTPQGSLTTRSGVSVNISGQLQGSLHVAAGAQVTISGQQRGSVHVEEGGRVTVEPHGLIAGSIHNEGVIVVRGVIGGTRSGRGALTFEGNGYERPPDEIKADGTRIYRWP